MMNRAASTPTAAPAPAPAPAAITTSLRRHQNHRIEPQAALSLAVASSHTPMTMTMTMTAPACRFESPAATAAAADVFLRVPNQPMQKQSITRTRGGDQFGDPPNSGITPTKKKKLSSTMLHFLKTHDFKNETEAAAKSKSKSKSNGPTTTTTRGTTTTILNHTDNNTGGRWDPYNLEDSFSSLSSLRSGSMPRITSRTFNRIASTPTFGVHNSAWPSSSSQQQQQQHTNRNKNSTSNAKFGHNDHLVLRSGLSHNHTHIIGRRGGMGMMQLSASTPALTLALSSASSSSSSSSALRSLAAQHRSNNT